MRYRVNVNECYYGVSNDKLMSKIIKADNVNNLIDKIKVDNDLSEYVDFDNNLNYDKLVYDGSNSFYLLLNDVFEFECELLKYSPHSTPEPRSSIYPDKFIPYCPLSSASMSAARATETKPEELLTPLYCVHSLVSEPLI